MTEIPFEITTLKRLMRFVLNYRVDVLKNALQETGLWHQGDWVDYEAIYDRSEISRRRRRNQKEIESVRRFIVNDVLIFFEKDKSSEKDSNDLKCFLELHQNEIVGWMHVRQKIDRPGFKWSQLDSDRQQWHFEYSDLAASRLLTELQVEDPELIVDMYSFLINSCYYLVAPAV